MTATKAKQSRLDQGIHYLELLRVNWSRQQIADYFKRSITHVNECVLLATANAEVQDAVRSGAISATLAAELLREHGDGAGEMIRAELAKVRAAGAAKLTRKTLKGRAVPKKLVERVLSWVDTLFHKHLPDLTAQELAERPAGSMVQVPAALLADLRAAHDEIAEIRAGDSGNMESSNGE